MTREEAIEVIRKNWPDASFTQLREALEILCPELRESEDKKIRQIITDSVVYQYGAGVEYMAVLDYLDKLEKQKVQMKAPTREEIRFQVALSCIQGVLEAKHGIIGEVIPGVAIKESLRIADEFVKQWFSDSKK